MAIYRHSSLWRLLTRDAWNYAAFSSRCLGWEIYQSRQVLSPQRPVARWISWTKQRSDPRGSYYWPFRQSFLWNQDRLPHLSGFRHDRSPVFSRRGRAEPALSWTLFSAWFWSNLCFEGDSSHWMNDRAISVRSKRLGVFTSRSYSSTASCMGRECKACLW